MTFRRTATHTDQWISDCHAHIVSTHGLSDLPATSDAPTSSSAKPEIYYIVLDAYARQDILEEIYDYDNSPFTSALRQRGFFVAEASNSNYAVTEFSLASTLNMAHIQDLPRRLDAQGVAVDEQTVRGASSTLIKRSSVVGFLRFEGYTIFAFDGGYGAVYLEEPDHFLQSPEYRRCDLLAVRTRSNPT